MEPFDLPSVPSREEEEDRERRWASFEQDCLTFAASEPDGFAAVIRAVARAMKDQQSLIDA